MSVTIPILHNEEKDTQENIITDHFYKTRNNRHEQDNFRPTKTNDGRTQCNKIDKEISDKTGNISL